MGDLPQVYSNIHKNSGPRVKIQFSEWLYTAVRTTGKVWSQIMRACLNSFIITVYENFKSFSRRMISLISTHSSKMYVLIEIAPIAHCRGHNILNNGPCRMTDWEIKNLLIFIPILKHFEIASVHFNSFGPDRMYIRHSRSFKQAKQKKWGLIVPHVRTVRQAEKLFGAVNFIHCLSLWLANM